MDIEHFQLVDEVIDIDTAIGRIRAVATVPQRARVFEGHFPGWPLLPGVLQIELMGQTAGLFLTALRPAMLAVLVGVDRARFRRQISPGERLEVDATQIYNAARLAVFECTLLVEGVIAAAAQIRLVLTEVEDPKLVLHLANHLTRHGLSPLMDISS